MKIFKTRVFIITEIILAVIFVITRWVSNLGSEFCLGKMPVCSPGFACPQVMPNYCYILGRLLSQLVFYVFFIYLIIFVIYKIVK